MLQSVRTGLSVVAVALVVSGLGCRTTASQPAPAAETAVAPKAEAGPAPAPEPVLGPRVQVEPRMLDFGTVWHNDPVEVVLRISNVGDEPLMVEFLPAWMLQLDTAEVADGIGPGVTAALPIAVRTDVQAVRADRSYGLRMQTNDPQNERVYVPIRGTVKPLYVNNSANRMTLFVGSQHDEVGGEIELTNNYDEPLPLVIQSYDDSFITAELEELEAGERYRLVARTKPPIPVGHRAVPVILDTGRAGRGSFVINVVINYR